MGTEGIDESEFSDVTLDYSAPAEEGKAADPAPAKEGEEAAAPDGEAKPDGEAAPAKEGGEGEPAKEGEEGAAKGEGDDPLRDENGKFKSGFQNRIDQLTRRAHDAERRAARAEAQLTAQNSSEEGAATAEPSPDEFDQYSDYIKALTKWQTAQSARENASTAATEATEEANNARGELWAAKVEASKTTLKDFDEVVGKSEIQIAPHVIGVLFDAEKGPELAYHLAQNPDLAAKLNDMSPARAAMELGRIESSLGPKAPVAKPSKAPAPIEPHTPGASTSQKIEDIDDMDDYVKRRKAQGASWA